MLLCFGYNSPGLIFNAILLFLCFAKMQFSSRMINYLSSSVFAVYLITDQTVIRNIVLKNTVDLFIPYMQTLPCLLIMLLFITLIMMVCCVIVDKIFAPIWSIVRFIPKKG